MSHGVVDEMKRLIVETAYNLPPAYGDLEGWDRYVKYIAEERERSALVWIELNQDKIMQRRGKQRLQYVLDHADIHGLGYIPTNHTMYATCWIHEDYLDFYYSLLDMTFPNVPWEFTGVDEIKFISRKTRNETYYLRWNQL